MFTIKVGCVFNPTKKNDFLKTRHDVHSPGNFIHNGKKRAEKG